ncbi:hypothetical protein CNY89_06780 [Amaricoccus sp. HAR-UPW-R2A-40]|nr:hypothetical protein CNY89_06780 [Amaricoccus sp. HAR-UPW-R2A-40]
MIKLTALYGHPTDPDAFETYYAKTHMPLVAKMPGPGAPPGGVGERPRRGLVRRQAWLALLHAPHYRKKRVGRRPDQPS